MKFENKIPISITIGGKDVNKIRINGEVVWQKVEPVDADYLYIENTYNGTNTISVKQTIVGSPDSSTYAKHLQYSKDKTNWTTITLSSTEYTITLNKGEKVYFRGNEGVFNYWYSGGKKKAITTISANQTHTVGGNINTLLDYQDPYGLTLPQGAFCGIFENNTKITSASDITFTPSVDGSLSTYCYLYLFKNCTNLTTVPKSIPAKKQGQDSCNGMFSYTAITTAPALSATILGNSCYYSLFEGCSKLVNAPQLPATEMKPNCYRSLFYGCTSLVNPPELPATTLAEGCYRSLFNGCTSLTTAPDLLASTLVSYCYAYLFNACTSLNSVKCTATSGVGLNNSTKEWLWNVSPTGTFTKESGVTWETGVSGIPSGWTVKTNEPDYFYVENTYNGSNTISVKQTITGSPDSSLYAKTLQYSKDKTNWTTITLSSTTHNINLNQGERVYFRGNEGVFNHYVIRGTEQAYTKITANQSHNLGGNINTLLNYYNPNNLTLPQGVFNNLFRGNVNLVSAENLTLQPSSDGSVPVFAYLYLFSNCTSLVKPPVLIAKTLSNGSYYSLFDGCSKLDNLTVYTDDNSQTNCTYKWLNGVASTGTLYNYGSATYTKNSVNGIPTGWTEVKPNEPDYLYIENTYNGSNTIYFFTTQSGIQPSSDKCSNQVEYSTDKVNWTTLTFNPSTPQTVVINTGEKLYLRNDTGVFNYYNGSANTYNTNINVSRSNIIGGNINTLLDYKNPDTVPLSHSCFFGLFRDNIATTDVSGLKFGNKTLSTGCYREMFYNCSKLTNGPELPATTLKTSCYQSLFYGCSKLNNVTVYADDISATNCTSNWLSGVASTGTFNNMGSATYTKDSVNGIPSGWTEVKS